MKNFKTIILPKVIYIFKRCYGHGYGYTQKNKNNARKQSHDGVVSDIWSLIQLDVAPTVIVMVRSTCCVPVVRKTIIWKEHQNISRWVHHHQKRDRSEPRSTPKVIKIPKRNCLHGGRRLRKNPSNSGWRIIATFKRPTSISVFRFQSFFKAIRHFVSRMTMRDWCHFAVKYKSWNSQQMS